MEYYGVTDVTITFAQNGCMLQFWGRYGKEGDLGKFTMVFPDVLTAMDVVESLSKNYVDIPEKTY
jgi:hypothetical protein